MGADALVTRCGRLRAGLVVWSAVRRHEELAILYVVSPILPEVRPKRSRQHRALGYDGLKSQKNRGSKG